MKLRHLLLLSCFAILSCGPSDPKDPKFTVAKVNGQKISRAELSTSVQEMAKRFGASVEMLQPEQIDLLNWQVANELVNEKLVMAAAAKLKDAGISKKVEEQFTKIKASTGSDQEFQERLTKSGMTEAKLRQEISKQVSMESLIENAYAKEMALAPDAAAKFYEANPEKFNQKEMVMARHILVLAKEGASKEEISTAKKKAEAARKEIEGGKSFEEVAKAVSEDPGSKERGGALPPFGRGQMVPAFEQVAFTSPVKKLSPVFQTAYGFHFLEVMDKRAARKVSLEEAKIQIEQNLLNEKRMGFAQKLIDKLRSEAKVTLNIPDPAKAKTPEAAVPPTAPAQPDPAKK
jgi:parvulin-like peptidyl-prolyl isomerase